jgi:hypothetical protein
MEKENNKLQPTKEQTTSLDLWRDSNAGTVALLQAKQFDKVSKSVPNKIDALLDCEPITSLIRYAGEQTVKEYLEVELIKLAGNFNGNPALNLKDHQVPMIAEMLLENYKWESIEDFTLCFRKASCGMYGEIYRIDGAVIGTWFSRYLDEKYQALEARQAKEKLSQKDDLKKTVQAVDGSPFLKQMMEAIGPVKEAPKDNAKENEYQREKMKIQSTNPDKAREILLKAQYARECTDLHTGKVIEGNPVFSEWLKSKKV